MNHSRDSGEVLVIIEPSTHADVWRRASAELEVRHAVSPRVHVVTGPAHALAALATTAGLHVLTADTARATAPPGLDPAETMFVDAWLSRRDPKVRHGEGLAWDAPGFTPPDSHDDTT
jgi:hypothetical protein